jgi:surface antigen
MKKVILTLCLALPLASTGCLNKEGAGTLLGGAGGALAGAQFGKGSGKLGMVAIGTLLGAFAGNQVGQSLDKADAMYAQKNAQNALEQAPTGQAMTWNNPDSGHSGTITPTRTFQDPSSGQYCREFQQTINVGGQSQKAFGRACRMPDGSWKIVQ